MHELGVLYQIVRTVDRIASENHIRRIKKIVLEVGESSGFVPQYLEKLYPIAIEAYPVLRRAALCLRRMPGDDLLIKEIGY